MGHPVADPAQRVELIKGTMVTTGFPARVSAGKKTIPYAGGGQCSRLCYGQGNSPLTNDPMLAMADGRGAIRQWARRMKIGTGGDNIRRAGRYKLSRHPQAHIRMRHPGVPFSVRDLFLNPWVASRQRRAYRLWSSAYAVQYRPWDKG